MDLYDDYDFDEDGIYREQKHISRNSSRNSESILIDDLGIWRDEPQDKIHLPLYDWKDGSKDPFYISEIEDGLNSNVESSFNMRSFNEYKEFKDKNMLMMGSASKVEQTKPVELNYSQLDQNDIDRANESLEQDLDESNSSQTYKANLLNRSFNRRFAADRNTNKKSESLIQMTKSGPDQATLNQLQIEYNSLLKKYAEAENTIDDLRLGAKVNLYSDPPTPHHGTPGELVFKTDSDTIKTNGSLSLSRAGQANTASHSTSQTSMTHSKDKLNVSEDNSIRETLKKKEINFKDEILKKSALLSEKTVQLENSLNSGNVNLDDQENCIQNIRFGYDNLLQDYKDSKNEYEFECRRQRYQPKAIFDEDKRCESQLYDVNMHIDALAHRVNQTRRPSLRKPFPATSSSLRDAAASEEFDRQFDVAWATDSDVPEASTVSTPNRVSMTPNRMSTIPVRVSTNLDDDRSRTFDDGAGNVLSDTERYRSMDTLAAGIGTNSTPSSRLSSTIDESFAEDSHSGTGQYRPHIEKTRSKETGSGSTMASDAENIYRSRAETYNDDMLPRSTLEDSFISDFNDNSENIQNNRPKSLIERLNDIDQYVKKSNEQSLNSSYKDSCDGDLLNGNMNTTNQNHRNNRYTKPYTNPTNQKLIRDHDSGYVGSEKSQQPQRYNAVDALNIPNRVSKTTAAASANIQTSPRNEKNSQRNAIIDKQLLEENNKHSSYDDSDSDISSVREQKIYKKNEKKKLINAESQDMYSDIDLDIKENNEPSSNRNRHTKEQTQQNYHTTSPKHRTHSPAGNGAKPRPFGYNNNNNERDYSTRPKRRTAELRPQPYHYTEVNPPSLQQLRSNSPERNPYLTVARKCIEQFTSTDDSIGAAPPISERSRSVDHLEYSRSNRDRRRIEERRNAELSKREDSRFRRYNRRSRSEHSRGESRLESRMESRDDSFSQSSYDSEYSDDTLEESDKSTITTTPSRHRHRHHSRKEYFNEDTRVPEYYSTNPGDCEYKMARPVDRQSSVFMEPIYSRETARKSMYYPGEQQQQQQQRHQHREPFIDHRYASPPQRYDRNTRNDQRKQNNESYIDRRFERCMVPKYSNINHPHQENCKIHGKHSHRVIQNNRNTPSNKDTRIYREQPARTGNYMYPRNEMINQNKSFPIYSAQMSKSNPNFSHNSINRNDYDNNQYICKHCGVTMSLMKPCPTCGKLDNNNTTMNKSSFQVKPSIPQIYLEKTDKKRQKRVKKNVFTSDDSLSEIDVDLNDSIDDALKTAKILNRISRKMKCSLENDLLNLSSNNISIY